MQKHLDKLIFLMETIAELKTKLRPEDTGHIHTTISTLEHIGFDNSIYNYGEFKKEKKNKNKL